MTNLRRKKITVLVVLILLLLAFTAGAVLYSGSLSALLQQGDVLTMTQSEDGKSVSLSVPAPLNLTAKIYYTTDGSAPTEESTPYTGPIALPEGTHRGLSVRAIVCQGKTESPVYTQTFFSEDSAFGGAVYTLCVTGDPADFWGDDGILSYGGGATTQDEANAMATAPVRNGDRANFFGYGTEWERQVTLELYSADGTEILHQDAGVRVNGGWGRTGILKSLRFYARKSYSEGLNTFSLADLNQLSALGNGVPVTEWHTLLARQSDHSGFLFNDEVCRRLAVQSGLLTVADSVPAVVYLNGEYYGITTLRPNNNTDNLAALCNLSDGDDIQFLSGSESNCSSAWDTARAMYPEDFDAAAAESYDTLYELVQQDLSVPENAAAVESMLDVDSCLLYYAVELYLNNVDWPTSQNFAVWRYAGTDTDPTNPYADGRWRMMLYDMDLTLNYICEERTSLCDMQYVSVFLKGLLTNESYRNRFINYLCDLGNTTLSDDSLREVYEQVYGEVEEELQLRVQTAGLNTSVCEAYTDEGLSNDTPLYSSEEMTRAVESFYDFQDGRFEDVLSELEEYYAAEGRYTLSVSGNYEHAAVKVNHLTLTEDFSGTYFASSPACIECTPANGYEVTGWSVNGTVTESGDTVLYVTRDMIVSGGVSVSPVLQKTAAQLQFSAVSYAGTGRWIEFVNSGDEPLSLQNCLVTKKALADLDNYDNSYLPDVTLQPGETIRIYAKNSSDTTLGSYQLGIKITGGKYLYLYDADGTLLDLVSLPDDGADGCCYRRDVTGWHLCLSEEEG